MKSLRSFVIVAVVMTAVPAFAQSPGAGWVQMSNGGWLPCSHPAASQHSGCATTPPNDTTTPPIVSSPVYGPGGLTGCDFPDATSPNGRSTACVLGQYRVGRIYWFTDVERAIVLSVAADVNGIEVVTVQFLDALGGHRGAPDHVMAFKNNGTYRPWVWLAEHGMPVELLPIVQ